MKKKIEIPSVNWKDLSPQLFTNIGDNSIFTPRSVGSSVLLRQLLSQKTGYLVEMNEEGTIEIDEADEDGNRYLDMMEKMGGRLLHKYIGDGFYQALFI